VAIGVRRGGDEGLRERVRVDDFQPQQLDVAGIVDEQGIRLQVAVG
jgi:hypothetical protein